MAKRISLPYAVFLAIGVFVASGQAPAATSPRPNVILILADDLGWADLHCYGSSFHETPCLDALAASGMRFTQAYAACPVCSPTRASLMAGKYPARLKITDWIGNDIKAKLLPAPYLDHLPLEEVTIARAMKEAGYATGFVGKWHLGGGEYLPEHQGFDVSMGANNGAGHPPTYFYPFAPPNQGAARSFLPGKPGDYLTDRLTDEALRFIESNRDKPFFLYLPHYAVHTPLMGKADLVAKYKQKAAALPQRQRFAGDGVADTRLVQDHPVYAAMVESLDQGVGRVLDKLKELDLEQKTIVIFFSDNGGLASTGGSPTSNLPLRLGKGWLYEGGIREPLIIRWPGVTRVGAVADQAIISNDFYPTILEMAGLALRPEQHVDAVSFAPVLRGEPTADRTPIFWHYPHYHTPRGGFPGGAVRSGDYKLIEWYQDMRCELYDLKTDPGEKTDLAATEPAKLEELRNVLHAWRASVHALMPTPNPHFNDKAEVPWHDRDFFSDGVVD